LHGAPPEVIAYSMAKYSRSALSMREAIADIGSQKASDFLNTFYFQYGHKSIGDLAHFPIAVEHISLLAAIEVVDEQRWDGQERSTRYQDFSKRLYYTPTGLTDQEQDEYRQAINTLFDGYDGLFFHALEIYRQDNPIPGNMTEAAYERTLRARTFDVARYLLPMATLTSVGQVLSARTLEGQVSRMFASKYGEVRDIAGKLRAAAAAPAFNPNAAKINELFNTIDDWDHGMDEVLLELRKTVLPEVAVAPTLVKYAEVHTYRVEVEKLVRAELLFIPDWQRISGLPPANRFHFFREFTPQAHVSAFLCGDVEVEIAASLLYQHSLLPFAYCLRWVYNAPKTWLQQFLKRVLAIRGAHDELLSSFRSGGGFIFDIEMDIGGMRDLHRHRRVTHIAQPYAFLNGYSSPEMPFEYLQLMYSAAIREVSESFYRLKTKLLARGVDPGAADYLLPLGVNRRFLMKMDVAEVAYIAQLRTQPAGHISYRRVAWEMFKLLEEIAPNVAAGVRDRITDPDSPLDFFKR